ncbi:MAG: uroporphyrinogen-III synthase [Bacteroidota bacterium]
MDENTQVKASNVVISTWPVRDEDPFHAILHEKGVEVLSMPLIEVHYLPFVLPEDADDFQWLVFTSKNGVHSFFSQHPPLPDARIAVIGGKTAQSVEAEGVQPDFTGSGKSGGRFAEELKSLIGTGQKVLLALGNLAPDTLLDELAGDNHVERVDVYETVPVSDVDPHIMKRVENDHYSVIAVSSPSAVKNLYLHAGEAFPRLRIVSVGETTSKALRSLGSEPLATSPRQSFEGLAEVVLRRV